MPFPAFELLLPSDRVSNILEEFAIDEARDLVPGGETVAPKAMPEEPPPQVAGDADVKPSGSACEDVDRILSHATNCGADGSSLASFYFNEKQVLRYAQDDNC
jgi:hypothetical protein